MNLTVVAIGLLGLYIGSGWLVDAASKLGRSVGVSQLMVGLTIITYLTTGPELLISLNAANRGADDLALGVLVGSNIINIGLILGVTGLVAGSMPIAIRLVRRAIPMMFGLALGVYLILRFVPFTIVWAIALVVIFFVFNITMIVLLRRDQTFKQLSTQEMRAVVIENGGAGLLADDKASVLEIAEKMKVNRPWELTRLVAGVLMLMVGSDYIVKGGLNIAEAIGANPVLLGSVFIAAIASMPEFISALRAVEHDMPDVAMGNLIGSSLTNLLLIIGLLGIVTPIEAPARLLNYEYPVMLALMAAMIWVALDGKLSRLEASLYVVGYLAFLIGAFVLF